MSVVHLGVDHVDHVPPPDSAGESWLNSLGLPERFVLYAGSLDARKNLARLLEALVSLRGRGAAPTLVLAGQSWFGAGEIETRIGDLRAEGMDIRPLGYLAPSLFYAVMRRASVFVFPSLYEGFGLPPLEAMRLGVPCVVSNAGALPEICGNGAVLVWPDDVLALATQIERLLSSPGEREKLAAAGRAQAARFTWDECASRTIEIYRQALV